MAKARELQSTRDEDNLRAWARRWGARLVMGGLFLFHIEWNINCVRLACRIQHRDTGWGMLHVADINWIMR